MSNYNEPIKYEVGKEIYLVPSDKRDKPYRARITKVGRKYAYAGTVHEGWDRLGRDFKIEIGENRTSVEYGSADDVYESEAIYEQYLKDKALQYRISKQLSYTIFDAETLEVIAEVIGLESHEEIK